MKKLLTLISLLAFCLTTFSQSTPNTLKEDLVSFENNKMKFTVYSQIQFKDRSNAEVDFSMEAPKEGLISRDYFVVLAATTQEELIFWMLKELNIKRRDYKKLKISKLSGEADIKIYCTLDENGMHVKLSCFGETFNHNESWDKILNDM